MEKKAQKMIPNAAVAPKETSTFVWTATHVPYILPNGLAYLKASNMWSSREDNSEWTGREAIHEAWRVNRRLSQTGIICRCLILVGPNHVSQSLSLPFGWLFFLSSSLLSHMNGASLRHLIPSKFNIISPPKGMTEESYLSHCWPN